MEVLIKLNVFFLPLFLKKIAIPHPDSIQSGNAKNGEIPMLFRTKKTINAEKTPMISLKLLKMLVMIKLG